MMFFATAVVFAGLANAINHPRSRVISGVQVVPGPGIAGISSPTDIIRDVEGEVLYSALTRQSSTGFCSSPGTVSTSDAQALGTYLRSLPATTQCSIHQTQYRADCAKGACVVLATANKAQLFMCLAAGQTNGISLASVNCNSIANYVGNIVTSCNANGMIYGGQYINPADYSASNNALGTNTRTANSAFFVIG